MKTLNTILLFCCLLSTSAFAQTIAPTPVPANIQVPSGHHQFFRSPASGTQIYLCLPSGNGFAWQLFGPQATFFFPINIPGAVAPIGNVYLSPNPGENGTPRATWHSFSEKTKVWAKPLAASSDPIFVRPGAVPWVLLQAVKKEGPTFGSTLMFTTFIQRVNTFGGIPPVTGCTVASNVGKTSFVEFGADYLFFRASQ